MEIRRIKTGESDLYKQVRLASLKDSPEAFSSTYESALQRSERSWVDQADGSAVGENRATFFALRNEIPVGLAALYRDADSFRIGELLQVWIAFECRGSDLAVQLMECVFEWGKSNGFDSVRAVVSENNLRAQKFYMKYGFVVCSEKSQESNGEIVLIKKV